MHHLDLQALVMVSMIIMWFTIAIYFDCSHVPSYSLFMLRSNKVNV